MIARHLHSRADASQDFPRFSAGPYQLYLRADLTPHAGALVDALRELSATNAIGAGNRGSGFRVALAGGPELFVRRCIAAARCVFCSMISISDFIRGHCAS